MSNQLNNYKMETLTITEPKVKKSKEVKEVTQIQLLEIINNLDKNVFVNIVSETVVRMVKKNNPYYGLVIKRTSRNYLIGNDYGLRKNNNLKKEGKEPSFVVGENKVGNHISKCVLFNQNTGKFYLQVELFKKIEPKTKYYFEGKEIDLDKFEKFVHVNTSQNDVNFISITVDNIKEITLMGTKYIIKGDI